MLENVPDIVQSTHGIRNIFADIRNVPTRPHMVSGMFLLAFPVYLGVIDIYLHFRKAENVARELSFLKIMRLYPLALLVTWLPRSILRFLISVTLLSANSSNRIMAGPGLA